MLNSKEINRSIVEMFGREGSDSWYKHSAAEILPSGTKCAKCGGSEFRKEMETTRRRQRELIHARGGRLALRRGRPRHCPRELLGRRDDVLGGIDLAHRHRAIRA